MGSPLWRLNP